MMAARLSQGTPRPRASRSEASDSLQGSRRLSRYPVTLPVLCTRLSQRAPSAWRGRTADVSGGGFAIDLPVRLRPKARVRVQVRTGIGPMQMEAEILWTRSVAGRPGIVRHGLCLSSRSEILQLPFGVLLGQWLQILARKPGGKARARPSAKPRPR